VKGPHFKIHTKLAVTYLVVIAIILLLINSQVILALEGNYLADQEAKTLANANIIALAGQDYLLSENEQTISFIKQYSEQMQSRIIVLDRKGKVAADSFAEEWLEERILTFEEVKSALKGQEKTGVHELKNGERVLYAVVPIIRDEKTAGAVMLVTSLEEIYADLEGIRRLMSLYSTVGGLAALFVSLLLAAHFASPINRLAAAVRRVSEGHLDQRVSINSKDEIGLLAEDFNDMAAKLEDADRTLRHFLSDASHELKTPLSSIKVLSQSLIDSQEQDPAVYRDFLQDISSEVDRMAALVNDMFQLAKLQDPDHPVSFNDYLVGKLLKHIKGLTAGEALQQGVDIQVQVGSDGEVLWQLNKDLFTCILLNLISNAIRYTPRGGLVTVTADVEEDSLVVRVTDTGIGISAEDLPRIFDRFYRVDEDRNRETGGTGLGLAITRQAVHCHGGTISVESVPGQGTTFEIRFPKHQSYPAI
jgi:two-component system OmpR family sensor kinase